MVLMVGRLFELAVAVAFFKGATEGFSIQEHEDYKMIGCFDEFHPTNLLFIHRDNIDWDHFEASVSNLSNDCARMAKKGDFPGFALHFYGECYGRTKSQLEMAKIKDLKLDRCVGNEANITCNPKIHKHCVGENFSEAIYIFELGKLVGAEYGPWSAFDKCSKSCGGGVQYRTRDCYHQASKNGLTDCSILGPSIESKMCNTGPCPWFTINWGAGRGVGADEEHIGIVQNKDECYFRCMKRSKNGRIADGATVDAARENSCTCVYDQTHRVADNSFINTKIFEE